MKNNEYEILTDALNLIDEQAEQGGTDYDESKAREKAYNLVADFIDKHASRTDVVEEAPCLQCGEKDVPDVMYKKGEGYLCEECYDNLTQ